MSSASKGTARLLLVGTFAAAVLAYFAVPAWKNFLDSTFAAFAAGDFTVMRDFVARYGAWAAAVSFFLMIFQSIAAPLPAFLITLANANLFGWWRGALLSWSSAMAGAAVCFCIARVLGRGAAEKLTSRAGLKSIDAFFERYGTHSVLIARLLPFISFDLVSYAAGLTSMGFWPFFIATGLGQTPATLIYSYVGGMLTGGAQMLVTGLLLLFALSALVVLLRRAGCASVGGGTWRRRLPADRQMHGAAPKTGASCAWRGARPSWPSEQKGEGNQQ